MPLSDNSVAEEILDALAPLLYNETGTGGPLTTYVTGLGQMFQLAETYASDDPDTDAIGYSMWMDLTRAPEEVLPWLAQFVGVQLSQRINVEADIVTNLIQNPSAEVDLFSISNEGGPVTRATEDSFFGSFSYKSTADGLTAFTGIDVGAFPNFTPIKPNTTYSVGAMIHPATATEIIGTNKLKFVMTWLDSNLVSLPVTAVNVSAPTNVWTPVSVNGIVSPSNAAFVVVTLESDGVTIAAGHAFYTDGFILTESAISYISSYFDGDTVPSVNYKTRWNGTPHKSSSTLTILPSLDQKLSALQNKISFKRGHPSAMISAGQNTLIGAKRIVLRERFTGDAYKINVLTFTRETPDPAATLAALLSQKPASNILTHTVVDGQDYQLLLDNNASYAAVLTKYATYAGMLADIPGA